MRTPSSQADTDTQPGQETIVTAQPKGDLNVGSFVGGRGVRSVSIWLLRAAIAAALLGAWQWYGQSSGGVFVPTLTDTIKSLRDLGASGHLGSAMWESNISVILGYPISVVAGVALGFLIGRRRAADRALSYWLDVAMVVPMVAIVPIIIVAFGLTVTSRVAVVVLFALPVIAMNSRAAVRVIDHNLVEMGQSFAARPTQIWTAIILPAALPQLFAGLRIGIGRAISGMIVIELLLVPTGLGDLLLNFKANFTTAGVYAVTVVVVAEGILLTMLGHLIEHWITRRMSGGQTV